MKNWYKPVKRAADLAGALLLMGILSPLFLLIMLAIAVDSEGGVLFAQSRMGKDGRPFIIFKFRTMYPPGAGGHPHQCAGRSLPAYHAGGPFSASHQSG